jgi:hypothetical protein
VETERGAKEAHKLRNGKIDRGCYFSVWRKVVASSFFFPKFIKVGSFFFSLRPCVHWSHLMRRHTSQAVQKIEAALSQSRAQEMKLYQDILHSPLSQIFFVQEE